MTEIQFASGETAAFPAVYPALGGRVLVPCQLFQAGPYPDKGVTITEADLDDLIHRFNTGGRQVPIRVEHIETPLDPLGHVVALHREGALLFGTLAFPVGLYSHIHERKADKVSVGLHVIEDEHGRGYLLHECSLVFAPRVAGAGFLSPEQIAATLTAYRQAGKLTPAMEGPLSRLFAFSSGVAFSTNDGNELRGLLAAFLEALPVIQPRGPLVPGIDFGQNRGGAAPTLSPEMTKWAQSMGLDPARVAQIKEGKA
jgi:hypothetical protein